MTEKKIKILWIANSPGPNQVDFFNEMAKSRSIDLNVCYCAKFNIKWKSMEPKSIKHKSFFPFNFNPLASKMIFWHLNPKTILLACSKEYNFVIVSGYTFPTAIFAMLVCKIAKKPFLFWGEMVTRKKTKIRNIITNFIIRFFVIHAEAVFTMGRNGVDSYRSLGISYRKIYCLPYSCDLSKYLSINRSVENGRIRHRIVITSRLVPVKQIDIAIESFLKIMDKHKKWDLIIVGDGPLKHDLMKMVPIRCHERIKFLGFKSKQDQIEIYRNSDIFLMTSRGDGWGMAVPEAMASGLPVVSTTSVESARILLHDRRAGFLISPEDIHGIVEKLELLIKNDKLRIIMSANAKSIAKDFDSAVIAKHCEEALKEIERKLNVIRR